VVRHGASDRKFFGVVLEYYKPKLVITVTDNGQGFEMHAVPEPGEMRSDGAGGERCGGFGFPLLEGLSDKIDFSSTYPHGTTVRVEKNLRYESAADAHDAERMDRDVPHLAAS
jgi:anti-sigma regulatory factor (Ser/Thr protein kinase)